jgi:hypothetical protein
VKKSNKNQFAVLCTSEVKFWATRNILVPVRCAIRPFIALLPIPYRMFSCRSRRQVPRRQWWGGVWKRKFQAGGGIVVHYRVTRAQNEEACRSASVLGADWSKITSQARNAADGVWEPGTIAECGWRSYCCILAVDKSSLRRHL